MKIMPLNLIVSNEFSRHQAIIEVFFGVISVEQNSQNRVRKLSFSLFQ
jgi:hypothetical protein